MTSFVVPSNKRPLVDQKRVAAFADGVNDDLTSDRATTVSLDPVLTIQNTPWVGLDDKKRSPAFSMRFTLREQAILKHVSETTPDSMHEFCLKAIRKALADHIASRHLI